MKKIIAFIVIGWACMAFAGDKPPGDWVYDGTFHKLIAQADRIVIRDGGFDCCRPVAGQKTLVEVKDPEGVSDFSAHVRFVRTQEFEDCKCCGYPGIDWYAGGRRIALTALQHGLALRWKGFPGDALLTGESSQWLAGWLLDRGVPDPHGELKRIVERQENRAGE